MKLRSLLPVAFVLSSTLGFVYACSAPDPGAIVYVPRNTQSTGDGVDGGPTPIGTGSTSDAAVDAGPTAPTTAFYGEGVYEAGAANDNSLNTSHAGLKNSGGMAIPSDGGYGNPAGMNCLDSSCHGTGGSGTSWVFAGTVFTNATTPAGPGVEVRLIDGKTGAVFDSLYTDPQGNFFSQTQNTAPTTILAGARNGTTSQTMATTPTFGCNNTTACHQGGANPMLP